MNESEFGRRRKLAILALSCMGLFVVGWDNAIIYVALPSIGRELQAWVSIIATMFG